MAQNNPQGTTKERRIYLTFTAEFDRCESRSDALMHTASTWKMPIRDIKPILVTERAKEKGIPVAQALEEERLREQKAREDYALRNKPKTPADTRYYFL